MDSKKESRKIAAMNDELLDQVSGGFNGFEEPKETEYYCDPYFGGCGNSIIYWTKPDYCIYCHRGGTLVEK